MNLLAHDYTMTWTKGIAIAICVLVFAAFIGWAIYEERRSR